MFQNTARPSMNSGDSSPGRQPNKLNLAKKNFAKKTVYLPEPGERVFLFLHEQTRIRKHECQPTASEECGRPARAGGGRPRFLFPLCGSLVLSCF